MSLRPPKSIAKVVNAETGLSMVEAEVLAETAASLGHHGKKVEAALVQLESAASDDKERLTRAAARAVWEYFIQRELCGMRDHRLIIKEMSIPDSVLLQLGAIR